MPSNLTDRFCSLRVITVPWAQPWPCPAPRDSTSRIRARITASPAVQAITVRRQLSETPVLARHTPTALQVTHAAVTLCIVSVVSLVHAHYLILLVIAATMVPQPCPNGTYTPPEVGGLREERECLPCPPGKFCKYVYRSYECFFNHGHLGPCRLLENKLKLYTHSLFYYLFVCYYSDVWVSKIFNVFEQSLLCSPRLHLFGQNTVKL